MQVVSASLTVEGTLDDFIVPVVDALPVVVVLPVAADVLPVAADVLPADVLPVAVPAGK